MNLEKLKELGMSEGQTKVYSAILEIGTSSLNNIQEKTGIERRNIYDILNKLIEKGFITYTIEKGKRTYQCAHPNKILEEINNKENNLKEIKSMLPGINELYKSSRPDIKAEVYRGDKSIKALLNEVLEHKESYWLGGNSFEQHKTVTKGLSIWFENWMNRRLKNKHWMNDLVSHGTWLKGLEPNKKSKHKKNYYRYKQLPKDMYTPMVLLIFGNKVAQIVWGKQPFAFVLDSKKVKDSYIKYFNYFWNS